MKNNLFLFSLLLLTGLPLFSQVNNTTYSITDLFESDSLLVWSNQEGVAFDSLSEKDVVHLLHISAETDLTARMKAVDSLLLPGKTKKTDQLAELYAIRAHTIYSVYLKEHPQRLDDVDERKVYARVLLNFKKSIDTNALCAPVHRVQRLQFLEEIGDKHEAPYKEDLKWLRAHGYREDRQGLNIGVGYEHGKHDLLGMDIAPFGMIMPRSFLRNTDSTGKKMPWVGNGGDVTTALAFFSLGYSQDLSHPSRHEYTCSLFRFTSPFLLCLSRFGFTQSSEYNKASWFYRPEAGLGYSFFSVGYAYNYVFSKSDRKQSDTHMLIIRISYPLVKYQNGSEDWEM
jgi:hypothetical protein